MLKSPTTTKEREKIALTRPASGWNQTAATHPGEMLFEEFMKPMGLTTNGLAQKLQITPSRLHDLIHQRRGMTADTALRLATYFEMSPHFWLDLQTNYDLAQARKRLRSSPQQRKAAKVVQVSKGVARKTRKTGTRAKYTERRVHPQ